MNVAVICGFIVLWQNVAVDGINFTRTFVRKSVPTIRVVTTLTSPFTMEHWNMDISGNSWEQKYVGYCVDLLKYIEGTWDRPEFFELQIVKDGRFGSRNSDGSWNGMIGELISGEADLALGPLTITKDRWKAVKFTPPFFTTGLSVMMKKPNVVYDNRLNILLRPFTPSVWIILVVFYFIAPDGSQRYGENNFSAGNAFWFTASTGLFQSVTYIPRSISGRFLTLAWYISSICIFSLYISGLVLCLQAGPIVSHYEPSIQYIEDLAKQSKVKYGIQHGGRTHVFFEENEAPVFETMWAKMNAAEPSVFVRSYEEGIRRVRESDGRYAFILEESANDYANSRPPCDTMKGLGVPPVLIMLLAVLVSIIISCCEVAHEARRTEPKKSCGQVLMEHLKMKRAEPAQNVKSDAFLHDNC